MEDRKKRKTMTISSYESFNRILKSSVIDLLTGDKSPFSTSSLLKMRKIKLTRRVIVQLYIYSAYQSLHMGYNKS